MTSTSAPSARDLARTAGLRELRVPRLEEVDRRRAQLWGLSLLVSITVPGVMVAVSLDVMPDIVRQDIDLRTARLALLAMLVVIMGYVAEREVTLRRLTSLLVQEQVLTASLVNRVDELDLLLRATRAMNSALDLAQVLSQITESARGLLRAKGVALLLVDPSDQTLLRVAAVAGSTSLVVGEARPDTWGLAGRAATDRDALLSGGNGSNARRGRRTGDAIAVPLEVRGQLVGVLTVDAGSEWDSFTEFDLRGLSVFANSAAAAITNARAYEEQTDRVAALLEADRAKDEFLTLISHELRTPLTSMIGLLGTLSTRASRMSSDQVREFAGIGQKQGWRLDRLITDLLDTSRSQSRALVVHPEPTVVDVLLGQAITALVESEPGHPVTLACPEHLVATVDPDVLLRITDNLVANAIKYTPDETPIEVRVSTDGRGLRLDVVDHGPGIPQAKRATVFEKFRRGDDPFDRGGLGLGLYVVQSLAQAHGGRVEVRDTPGGGATFCVWLGIGD